MHDLRLSGIIRLGFAVGIVEGYPGWKGSPDARKGPAEPIDAGGGGPNNPDVNERVAKLEAILPTLATKADVEAVRGDIKGWMLATVVTIIVAVVGAVATLATVMRAPSTAQASNPIIITIPSQAAPSPPAK